VVLAVYTQPSQWYKQCSWGLYLLNWKANVRYCLCPPYMDLTRWSGHDSGGQRSITCVQLRRGIRVRALPRVGSSWIITQIQAEASTQEQGPGPLLVHRNTNQFLQWYSRR
jgi:hypothetical protein